MLVLTLDTSTPSVTAAVSRLHPSDRSDGGSAAPRSMVETLAGRHELATNRHGELLAPMIDSVLREADVAPRDLQAVGVGLGPGPFTGLRVGIMTAAALGDALGVPVYGECSLDVLGSWPASAPTAVVADARRKQVYWATYRQGRRIEGPDIAPPEVLAQRLREQPAADDERYRVAGAGAVLYREAFEGFRLDEASQYPSAAELAVLLRQKVATRAPGDDLTPLYLRRPDATPPSRPKLVTPA